MIRRATLAALALAFTAINVAAPTRAQTPVYAALDPRGTFPAVERIPLAPRLPSLASRRIYIIMSWPSGSGMDQVARDIAGHRTWPARA